MGGRVDEEEVCRHQAAVTDDGRVDDQAGEHFGLDGLKMDYKWIK